MLYVPAVLLQLFAAAKLHLDDPRSSPARVQGMFGIALGWALMFPFFVYPVFQPLEPASADPTVALLAAIGVFSIWLGCMKWSLEHFLTSVFQMVYSLEPAKANRWTRWIALYLGVLELRAMQKTVSRNSSIGKTLKMLIPVLVFGSCFGVNGVMMILVIAFVPWVRHRAWAFLQFVILNGGISGIMMALYELQQLRKRNALKKQQRQINPLDANDDNPPTSIIASTIAATKKALLNQKQVRREASASLVLHSGVSLAFLELFLREHRIDASMTANDVVNKHVKPHTKDIGLEGSGAYVELIGAGADVHGKRWCSTPTHMLSYSWSYSVGMIVAALRKYEQENPPSKGKGGCYYYFVDQVYS
jgi:hypothetical protein